MINNSTIQNGQQQGLSDTNEKLRFDISSPNAKHELCKYKGVEYVVPKDTRENSTFNRFKLSSQGNIFNFNSNALIIDPQFKDKSRLEITLFSDYEFVEYNAFIYLYRKGQSQPIDFRNLTDDFCIEAFFSLSYLYPGDYFFVISNFTPSDKTQERLFELMGDRYIYPFTVFHFDNSIKSPTVKLIESEIPPLPTQNTDDPLFFTMRFKESTPCLKIYDAVCVSKDLSLVSYSPSYVVREHSRILRLYFKPKSNWKAGTYYIYIQVNTMPVYKVSFDVSDSEDITFNWELINQSTEDYLICKAMHNTNSAWRNLIDKPGTKQLQNAVKSHLPLVELNETRKKKDLEPHSYSLNFTIATDNGSFDESALRDFACCLHNVDHIRVVTDKCENLINSNDGPFSRSNSSDLEINLFNDSCLCITNIHHLCSPQGIAYVDLLIEEMTSHTNYTVFIVGTERQIYDVFQAHSRLKAFFPKKNHLQLEPLTAIDIAHSIYKHLGELNVYVHEDHKTIFQNQLEVLANAGKLKKLTDKDILHFVYSCIMTRYTERIKHQISHSYGSDIVESVIIDDIDINQLADSNNDQDYATELNNMIGLQNLKTSLAKMFNLTKFNQMRHSLGLKSKDNGCHHMIFTGNPGTGKTTVAKLIGKAFHSIGILSKGDVIVTERSKIVGRYLGETEKNISDILSQAQGNVLFVDEAYTLITDSDDRRDFGNRIIDALLTVLSQKNPDMVIIFAGYKREIERMLDVNPGLNGRFPHRFNFDDYSAQELMLIAEQLIESEQYKLTNDARRRLHESIAESLEHKNKNFSNARWITQYVVNGIIPEVANRLISSECALDVEAFQTITIDDVNHAYKSFSLAKGKSIINLPKVGFKIA